MLKILSLLSIVSLSFIYAVGFIYDSASLEYFNLNFTQILGNPLEYLAIGSTFLVNKVVAMFTVLFLFLGVFACALKPVERALKQKSFNRYIDVESIPYVLMSLSLPLLLFLIIPIISSAQNDTFVFVEKQKNNSSTINYSKDIKYMEKKGFIFRKRDGFILFYDIENSVPILIPQRNVLHYVGNMPD